MRNHIARYYIARMYTMLHSSKCYFLLAAQTFNFKQPIRVFIKRETFFYTQLFLYL